MPRNKTPGDDMPTEAELETLNKLRQSADQLMVMARDCRTLAAQALAEVRERQAKVRKQVPRYGRVKRKEVGE